MRLKQYTDKQSYPFLSGYMSLMEFASPINEVSDETFETIKAVGKTLGVRIKRSDSLFDYLKRAGRGINDLFRHTALFLSTDLGNKDMQRKIIQDAKQTIRKLDKKELVAFLLQLDRGTLGITSHIRHVLMSFFGIEIATYNKWLEDKIYIEKELRHIKIVLKRMGFDEKSKEYKAITRFENIFQGSVR